MRQLQSMRIVQPSTQLLLLRELRLARKHLKLVTLRSTRLVLRPPAQSDFQSLHRILSRPEVAQCSGWQPYSVEQSWWHLAALMGHWQIRGYGTWVVEDAGSGQLIGRIGFVHPEGSHGFELGWLLDPAFWGKGYATEGATGSLHYAFSTLSVPEVFSFIAPGNTASIRVAERIGMRRNHDTVLNGVPMLSFSIHRRAWHETRTALRYETPYLFTETP